MPVTLDGVRAKLARAEKHVGELRTLVDPIVAVASESIRREEEANGTKLVYRLTDVPRIEPEVAVIVGDVLHNVRSALDHLAWQLVLFDGGQPIEGPSQRATTFPIYDSTTNDKGNPRTVTIQPGIRDQRILDALVEAQPFHEANYGHDPADDALWLVKILNNIDKHRLLLAVVCSLDDNLAAYWGSNEGDPSPRVTTGPLDVGSVVATFDFEGHPAPRHFEPKFSLAVSLMMPKGRWLNHKSVVEGLEGLVHGTRWQINHGGFVRLLNERPV